MCLKNRALMDVIYFFKGKLQKIRLGRSWGYILNG